MHSTGQPRHREGHGEFGCPLTPVGGRKVGGPELGQP